MLKTFTKSISAGILVSVGGCVYLACENQYVGAALFSVALLCIYFKKYSLFTGKIGYLVTEHSKKDFAAIGITLVGNVLTTFVCGVALRFAVPKVGVHANEIFLEKLTETVPQTFIRAIFCGLLLYVAVSSYLEKNGISAMFLAVPVFILCGFEHSIADMFYFGASGMFSFKMVFFIFIVILGNLVGGLLMPLIHLIGEKSEKSKS